MTRRRNNYLDMMLGFGLVFIAIAMITFTASYTPSWFDAGLKPLMYLGSIFVFVMGAVALF